MEENPEFIEVILLTWLVDNRERIDEARHQGILLREEEVSILDARMRQRISNPEASLGLVRQYFDADGWMAVAAQARRMEESDYICFMCNEQLGDRAVQCSQCLDWFHYACVGFKRKPKRKHYYCDECLYGLPEEQAPGASPEPK